MLYLVDSRGLVIGSSDANEKYFENCTANGCDSIPSNNEAINDSLEKIRNDIISGDLANQITNENNDMIIKTDENNENMAIMTVTKFSSVNTILLTHTNLNRHHTYVVLAYNDSYLTNLTKARWYTGIATSMICLIALILIITIHYSTKKTNKKNRQLKQQYEEQQDDDNYKSNEKNKNKNKGKGKEMKEMKEVIIRDKDKKEQGITTENKTETEIVRQLSKKNRISSYGLNEEG